MASSYHIGKCRSRVCGHLKNASLVFINGIIVGFGVAYILLNWTLLLLWFKSLALQGCVLLGF